MLFVSKQVSSLYILCFGKGETPLCYLLSGLGTSLYTNKKRKPSLRKEHFFRFVENDENKKWNKKYNNEKQLITPPCGYFPSSFSYHNPNNFRTPPLSKFYEEPFEVWFVHSIYRDWRKLIEHFKIENYPTKILSVYTAIKLYLQVLPSIQL